MTIETEVARTFHVKATCDNCGVVKTWEQATNPDIDGDALQLGFTMWNPSPGYREPVSLWFHEAACVHAYVESNVIEYVRHPDRVKVPA